MVDYDRILRDAKAREPEHTPLLTPATKIMIVLVTIGCGVGAYFKFTKPEVTPVTPKVETSPGVKNEFTSPSPTNAPETPPEAPAVMSPPADVIPETDEPVVRIDPSTQKLYVKLDDKLKSLSHLMNLFQDAESDYHTCPNSEQTRKHGVAIEKKRQCVAVRADIESLIRKIKDATGEEPGVTLPPEPIDKPAPKHPESYRAPNQATQTPEPLPAVRFNYRKNRAEYLGDDGRYYYYTKTHRIRTPAD
jgi:hypothetical protein